MGTYCWPQCAGERARAVALFLKCYEGKYANTENLTDPTRRPACMKNAGLDFQAVHACSQNTTAGSLLSRIGWEEPYPSTKTRAELFLAW